jgi:hypothetical protein
MTQAEPEVYILQLRQTYDPCAGDIGGTYVQDRWVEHTTIRERNQQVLKAPLDTWSIQGEISVKSQSASTQQQ